MTAKDLLVVSGLTATVNGEQILNGMNITIRSGEIHAIMGPNGSGKSTLAKVLAGHPGYEVTGGTATIDGANLLEMEADERARAGLFLAFQYPQEVPGVSILNFLRTAYIARFKKEITVLEFRKLLFAKMDMLGMDHAFATRFVNEGFSGGEKKRNEILQMAILQPRVALLDETDSGLDIDALKVVSNGVNRIIAESAEKPGVLLITHYERLLNYITPHFVHVLAGGRIIESGGPELAKRLEAEGYDWVVNKGAESQPSA